MSKQADLRGATANDPPDGEADQQRLMYYTADAGGWRLIQEDINDDFDDDDDDDRRFIYMYGIRGTDDIAVRRQRTLDAQGNPTGTPTDYFHITDPLFSTVAVLDHAAKVLERIEYTPYGLALHHPPTDITGDRLVDNSDLQAIINNWGNYGVGDLNRDGVADRLDQALVITSAAMTALPPGRLSRTDNIFGFTGQIYNQEVGASGAYLYRMRWYDALLGRFLSRDPAGYIDGMLLYAYVSGNPLAMIDPLGLWGLGEWWNNTCEGVKGLFIGTSDLEAWNKARAAATANQNQINERLVNEGKMAPEHAAVLKAELESAIAMDQASDVAVTQKRLDFVETGALLVPGVGPAISTAATATNAGISVSQGNYTQAALGMVPGVGGDVLAKAGGKMIPSLLKRGPAPNGGVAKPHGGGRHNSAIDNEMGSLRGDRSVTDIRKNQVQVDAHGNRVGNNRPDLQYDRGGVHHNVEFDFARSASYRHGQTIRGNDPLSQTYLHILE